MTTPVTVRPVTAQIENSIRTIGGISTTDLAKQFDTPLYIMDVATVRNNCRHYTDSLKALNVDYTVAYAGKAGMCFKLLNLLAEEGLGTDVVSGGEIHTVLQTNIDRDKIYFHGNNKSKKELEMAIEAGIRIVIDNAYELQLIDSITKETGKQAQLLIRLKPEIEAHTHEHIQTGQIESKFGVSKAELIPMIQTILDAPNLQFLGIHGHIGSQIFDPIPYEKLAHLMMDYLIKIKQDTQAPVLELNLGGGIGIDRKSVV